MVQTMFVASLLSGHLVQSKILIILGHCVKSYCAGEGCQSLNKKDPQRWKNSSQRKELKASEFKAPTQLLTVTVQLR